MAASNTICTTQYLSLIHIFDQIEELSRLKGRLSGVPTGLYELDRMLTGLHGLSLIHI